MASKQFISSTVFRQAVNLLTRMVDLPATLQLNRDGEVKECVIFHRMILVNYHNAPTNSAQSDLGAYLEVTSFPVSDYDLERKLSTNERVVDPEFDFNQEFIFWAGNPMRVFKDYSPLNDKKFGKLSWCASYERDLFFPRFVINEEKPLFTSRFTLESLALMDVPEEKRKIFVGSVDEDGNVTAPRVLSNTVNDGPRDMPRKNATPYFAVDAEKEKTASILHKEQEEPQGLLGRLIKRGFESTFAQTELQV